MFLSVILKHIETDALPPATHLGVTKKQACDATKSVITQHSLQSYSQATQKISKPHASINMFQAYLSIDDNECLVSMLS